MAKHLKKIPDAELAVMQAVWDCQSPVSRSQVEKQLPPSMATTTLLTLLSRLVEKGYLTVDKDGKSNLYTPTVTREAYLAEQSKRFIDLLCGGSMSAFASALCHSSLSKEDIRELRRLLDEGEGTV